MRELLSHSDFSLIEKDFFVERFTVESLRSLLTGVSARAAFAARSPVVKKLNLNLDSLQDDELIKLMVDEPRLIRRPMVWIDGRIILGATKSVLANLLDVESKDASKGV